MPPLLRFTLARLASIPITLFLVTLALYGCIMLTPPEVRASLYFSSGVNPDRLTEEQMQVIMETIIERQGLRDPFPIQYLRWASRLVGGDWGWSPAFGEQVLPALLRRTPVTAELALYSILLFIPLGVVSGVLAGWKKDRRIDFRFRLTAFVAGSLPPFILALVLLAVFYVILDWFAPERLSIKNSLFVQSQEFRPYTGFMTIDGFLNLRPEISLDAFRHLVLPVVTLSLVHWATLGRLTRETIIDELHKDYITAGKARGISERILVWRHAFRNSLTPALNSSMLSVASLLTGVFIVEVIFDFNGISELAVISTRGVPDAPAILGFAIYNVILVLVLMFLLDVIQAALDPRIREGIIGK